MLKDYIDSSNDATSEFLTDMPEINNMMSEEITSETQEVEHVVTIVDDVFEIEYPSVAEEIVIEDVKIFDSSSNSEVDAIGNDNVEELQSPISDRVEDLITNEPINSKQVLANNEFDEFLDKIVPNNEDISTNGFMEIDAPFLNGNTSQNTNDVEFVSQDSTRNQNNVPLPNTSQALGISSDSCNKRIATEAADKPYKCHICGKLFSRNSSLKCHIRLHVEGPDSLLRGSSEPLDSLKSRFVELNAKKEEVVEPVVDENATDTVHDETAPTDVLNSSRDSVELTEDEEKRDYKCILCLKTFSRKSSLTFHYRFHPKSPTSKSTDDITVQNRNDETAMEIDSPAAKEQYKCGKCPRTFELKNAYAWHLKMHETNVRRKSSDVVPAVNQTGDLQETIVNLTGDVDTTEDSHEVTNENGAEHIYKCHLCPRSFPQLRGLKTHSGVHKKRKMDEPSNGSEPLNQIVYEEVSSRKYPCSSKRHNHDDDEVTKLYKCNVCCKCFCDITHLKRHLARNHQEDDTSDVSDEDYMPESRNKTAETKKVFKKPRKQVNTRTSDDFKEQKAEITIRGLYKCGVCNESFDEIQLLADHVNVHIKAHNDSLQDVSDDTATEELCCVGCNLTFRNQNGLSRHMNEHRRQEEEILVRVTSSGRKIRERRSSEDLTTNSPIKCIPCNRSFESIRAKRIHDASKHPVVQSESEEEESNTDDESSDDQSNNDYVCDCCNRNWRSLRALGIHKSWNRHKKSLTAAEELDVAPLAVEDQDPLEPDTPAEENKTENDVSSSVKCGRCNELFPNIPALNAHRCGQTNGTTVDSANSSVYEKKDMASCDSLRDLVKCDRCDKFFVGIPALKLHIISDHTKKSATQNSTEEQNSTTASIAVPDNVIQTESRNEPNIEKEKPTGPNVTDSLADIPTQSNDKIVDKPDVATVSQTDRRRKSVVVDSTLAQQTALFHCDLCDETFTSNRALNSHKSVHAIDSSIVNPEKPAEQTNDRTYVCCDKTFTSSKGLKIHQRFHPATVILSADITPSTSEEPSNQHHTENDTEKVNDIETIGDLAAVTNSLVNYPVTDTESEEEVFRQYKCSICFKVFDKQKFLRLHRRKKHFGPDEIDPEETIGDFPCPKCHKKFDKESSLRVHKAYHTTQEKNAPIDCGTYTDMRNGIYKCNKCEKEFETHRGAMKHYSIMHKRSKQSATEKVSKEAGEYPCPLCDRSFNCSQGLAGHMWAHKRGCARETAQSADEEETDDLSCVHCDISFSNEGNLRKHRRSFHADNTSAAASKSEQDFYCAVCEKSFVTKGNLKRHRKSLHGIDSVDEDTEDEEHDESESASADENGSQKEYPCTDCRRVFTSYRGLNGHRQMHQQYPCSECEETFSNIRLYNTHKETHIEGEFKCDQCDRTFKSARSLGGHKPTHYGENVKENEPDNLVEYQDAENNPDDGSKVTNNEGEFKCGKCDRTFKSARSLGGHKPTHYGEKDDENESDDGADYHDAENESADDADNEGDDQSNEYQCHRCDRSCSNQRSLTIHMNTHIAHDNPLELPCPQCERVFNSHRALGAHYLGHRGGKLHQFPCPKCKTTFPNMKSMYEHFCKVHKRRGKSKRPVPGDSKPTLNNTEIESSTATPALPSIVDYPCTKCGQKFDSETTLIDHKKVCKTRSRSVGARMNSRDDNSIISAADGDNSEDTPNSNDGRSRRRAKSSSRLLESSKPLNDELPMELDTQKDCNKDDAGEAAKSNMQLSCVINDQINTTDDTEAEPKCDLCSLPFKDLKSLAKHMADSHESTTNNSVDKKFDFGNLPVRVHHCTQCDKIFANRVGLRRHSLTHSEPVPLPKQQPASVVQCPSCPRKFFSVIGLRRHSRVHKNSLKSVATNDVAENTLVNDSAATESETNQVAIPPDHSVVENHVESAQTSDVDRSLVEQPVERIENLTNGVDESINATNESLPELFDQIIPNHDDAIDRIDDPVEDAIISSNDTQPNELIDEANSAQAPALAVSNEAIPDLTCYLCSRRFGNIKKLNKHLQFHKFNDGAVDGEETSINESPKQRYSSDGSLMNGTPSVNPLAYVKCEICSVTFKKDNMLKKHAFETHNVIITSPILYHCDFCHKPFSQGKSLLSHLKSHTTPGNNYSSSSSEEDGMPYECISCEKCFRLKSDLLEHVKTHDANNLNALPSTEPLVNGSVDEKSATLNGNTSDVSVHSENYELRINSDDDNIDDKNNHVDVPVTEAIQVQQPELEIISKPKFQCSECSESFDKQRTLSIHSRIHKKKQPQPKPELDPAITRSSKKDHKCPLCEMSFNLKTSLAIHVQKHSGVKLLRKALKRANNSNDMCAEDGVRSSKRVPIDIS